MEARRKAGVRLLVVLSLALSEAALCSSGAPRRVSNLYVRVGTDECGLTRLTLTLENVTPLPPKVFLRIKSLDDAEGGVVAEQLLDLTAGKYVWAGIIRFAEYRAELLDAGARSTRLGDYVFTNEILARQYVRAERATAIQIRGSAEPAEQSQPGPERNTHVIANISTPAGVDKIHIILINSKDELADQYLGPPVTSWTSRPLPLGDYRQIILGYKNGCGPVRVTTRE